MGLPGQHSSSDPGSDLDELLTRDFPTEDLPSLISRAMGKGELHYCQRWLFVTTPERVENGFHNTMFSV